MLRSFLILGMLAAPSAFAQTAEQSGRFYHAIEAMSAQSITFYSNVDPRFEPLLFPSSENQKFRENQHCFLTRIATDGGAEMLEEYITAMEVQGTTKITNLIDLANDLPPVLTHDLVFAASLDCGPLSFTTQQMMTPEFIELMDDPDVMQRLMGQ